MQEVPRTVPKPNRIIVGDQHQAVTPQVGQVPTIDEGAESEREGTRVAMPVSPTLLSAPESLGMTQSQEFAEQQEEVRREDQSCQDNRDQEEHETQDSALLEQDEAELLQVHEVRQPYRLSMEDAYTLMEVRAKTGIEEMWLKNLKDGGAEQQVAEWMRDWTGEVDMRLGVQWSPEWKLCARQVPAVDYLARMDKYKEEDTTRDCTY